MSRYVTDCTTVISAVCWSGLPLQVLQSIVLDDQWVVSDEIVDEYFRFLSRPKFAKFQDTARDTLRCFLADAEFVDPAIEVTDCNDASDNKYLECALEAEASAIITGDHHLLRLHPWRGISILRVAEFLEPRATAVAHE